MNTNNFENNNIINTKTATISSGSTTKVRNFYITLAKESPKYRSYDSSSDTYDSFHLRETDYCKDTTDTLSDSSYTTDEIATVDVVEYEVASRSASENLYSNDSSSGTEDIFLAVATKAAATFRQQYECSDSDFADIEESNDDFQKDSELGSADYWNCVKCKNKQNNPMFRYCERCYQIRKSHFPPRPPRRRSRTVLRQKSSLRLNDCSHYTSLSSSISDDNERRDSKHKLYENHSLTTPNIGKLCNNNNNNNNNIGETNKTISESSFARQKFINTLSKSQLNSAAESPTSADDSDDSNSNSTNKYKEYDTREIRGGHYKEEKNFNILNSEDELISIKKVNESICRRKKSLIRRDTNSLVNFFSTPKFSKNLKRKNPFSISLLNNAKRIFVNNSLCSSVTNLTNNYSSSNNSSINAMTTNSASCSSNILEKRDTNLKIENSETDLTELNIRNINSFELKKDSGISCSSSGPSSSQEYFSSVLSSELLTTNDINSIINLKNSQEVSSSNDNISKTFVEKISKDIEIVKTSGNFCASDDTVTDEIDCDSINNDNSPLIINDVQKEIEISEKIKMFEEIENKRLKSLEKSVQIKESDSTRIDSCIVCLDEPKNGVFVHSRVLHLCCCYKCAVKIWNKNKKCPICNCTVKNVMKLFIH